MPPEPIPDPEPSRLIQPRGLKYPVSNLLVGTPIVEAYTASWIEIKYIGLKTLYPVSRLIQPRGLK